MKKDLLEAARIGIHYDVHQHILREEKLDIRNADGQTPLILAAAGGHPQIVKMLIKHGASIELVDSSGKTALDYAKLGGHDEVYQWLRVQQHGEVKEKSDKQDLKHLRHKEPRQKRTWSSEESSRIIDLQTDKAFDTASEGDPTPHLISKPPEAPPEESIRNAFLSSSFLWDSQSIQQPPSEDEILVASGSFHMGDPSCGSDASPTHIVTLQHSFIIAKYQVTVRDFTAFVHETKYQTISDRIGGIYVWNGLDWVFQKGMTWQKTNFNQDEMFPVTCITWYDSIEYCNWYSQKNNLTPCYHINANQEDLNNLSSEDKFKWNVKCDFQANGYRLPTEAEWEYAAKGGTKTRGYRFSGSNDPSEVAWYIEDNVDKMMMSGTFSGQLVSKRSLQELNNGTPRPVGTKQPNELGIHDMSGNVREWCWDWYKDEYYKKSPSQDPTGPSRGAYRVIRGGSWQANTTDGLKSAFRNYGWPQGVFTNFGFRVVRTIH